MRYDKEIYFVQKGEEKYDYNTGDYIETKPIKFKRYARVTDVGAEKMQLIYGELKKGAKTVRIQNHYLGPFDYIEIDEKKYSVQLERRMRNDRSFEVVEK